MSGPLRLLCYCAPIDEPYRAALNAHLAQFERENRILQWDETRLLPGADRTAELDAQIQAANVILLLVSADFLASDACQSFAKVALDRRASGKVHVVPVIVRPVVWQTALFGHLSVLPKSGLPVSRWENSDEAWREVTEGILRLVTESSCVPTNPTEFSNLDSALRPVEGPRESSMPASKPQLPIPAGQISSSPFCVGLPPPHPARFYGRDEECKRILSWLENTMQSACVIGPKRSGMTSLLRYLISRSSCRDAELRADQRQDELHRLAEYHFVYIGFQDARYGSRVRLLRELATGLGIPFGEGEHIELRSFIDHVKDKIESKSVILFDDIGIALERYSSELDDIFWSGLRALVTTQSKNLLSYIVTSRDLPSTEAKKRGLDSPFFNIFNSLKLKPLKESEARALIDGSPQKFPTADIDWILARSAGWPTPLQILCQERLLALQLGDLSADWRDRAQEQLAVHEASLRWTKPTPLVSHPTRVSLRVLLNSVFIRYNDMLAFVIDHYPDLAPRIANAGDRVELLNIIIQSADSAELIKILRDHYSEIFEAKRHLLQFE